MTMFHVLVEMPDGPTKRKGGKTSTPLRHESTYYDAPDFATVHAYAQEQMLGMWAEGRLVKIEDIGVPITTLPEVLK